MRIGLIGLGTIGKQVARAVEEGRAGDARIAIVLVRDTGKVRPHEAELLDGKITSDPEKFFSTDFDIGVEAAGHEALRQYAERILRRHSLLAVSVGALADQTLLSLLREATEASKEKLLIPSGALGALDAVSAGVIGAIEELTLIVRKPPSAWKGTAAEEVATKIGDSPVCFYEGKAREAVISYPQNVNVLAALSLAGLGFDRTNVQMYVDPTVKHNTFELFSRGEFGELKLELRNRPFPENPKTGHLVVFSLIKAIRRLQERIVVGF